jgi:hypothetical protein
VNPRLAVRLLKSPAAVQQAKASIGMAATENAARAAYQSARTKLPDGGVAPLPLTLAEALAEAEKTHTFRQSKDLQ